MQLIYSTQEDTKWLPKGIFTQNHFLLNTENFFMLVIGTRYCDICILAVHLHSNSVLGAWKLKLLTTDFKVQGFENGTFTVSM